MRNKDCPQLTWDSETGTYNFDEILTWEGAKVVFSDTFTGPKGTFKRPELAHWTLLDSSGFVGFDGIKKEEDERIARAAGAIFLFLYHHTKLDIGMCEQFAQAWVLRYKF